MSQLDMDFLSARSNRAIKTELRSIVDSYHHYWDPLAELLQNSRDAIIRSRSLQPDKEHFIRIQIDANARRIEVLDNGVGIPGELVRDVLGPGGGDKSEQTDEVGEKGVGLTYSVFCSDEFRLESRHEDNHHGGQVRNARTWLESDDHSSAPPPYSTLTAQDLTEEAKSVKLLDKEYDLTTFTKIAIASIPVPPDDYDLFAFSADQLRALISTRTAVGVTDRLYEDPSVWEAPFDAYINFKLPTGGTGGLTELEVGYRPPHTLVEDAEVMSLSKANAGLARQKDESRRHKFLHGKTVWEATEVSINGRAVDVYGVMFPGNKVFEQLAETEGLKVDEESNKQDPTLLESAILVGTKSMPTGVTIPEGPGGAYPAYYKRCLFVVESDSVRFDMGRKSMHHVYRKRLQSAVTEVFRSFEALAPYQSPERVTTKASTKVKSKAERDAEREKKWERNESLVDLDTTEIPFQKVPNGQEAGVAAIFHELLGASALEGYLPLSTGYAAQYDLDAHYKSEEQGPLRLEIEFKHDLDALVKDLNSGRKNFDDIHLLVAWTANAQKLRDSGFFLEMTNDSVFAGVTHEVTIPIPGIEPIPVILLEEWFKRQQR